MKVNIVLQRTSNGKANDHNAPEKNKKKGAHDTHPNPNRETKIR